MILQVVMIRTDYYLLFRFLSPLSESYYFKITTIFRVLQERFFLKFRIFFDSCKKNLFLSFTLFFLDYYSKKKKTFYHCQVANRFDYNSISIIILLACCQSSRPTSIFKFFSMLTIPEIKLKIPLRTLAVEF